MEPDGAVVGGWWWEGKLVEGEVLADGWGWGWGDGDEGGDGEEE
jgi:hypothetical protein